MGGILKEGWIVGYYLSAEWVSSMRVLVIIGAATVQHSIC
jgi:hypothetical protein